MRSHNHFLDAVERDIPVGKLIEAVVDNYTIPRGQGVARTASSLDIPFHADFRTVADRHQELLLGADTQPYPT